MEAERAEAAAVEPRDAKVRAVFRTGSGATGGAVILQN